MLHSKTNGTVYFETKSLSSLVPKLWESVNEKLKMRNCLKSETFFIAFKKKCEKLDY